MFYAYSYVYSIEGNLNAEHYSKWIRHTDSSNGSQQPHGICAVTCIPLLDEETEAHRN